MICQLKMLPLLCLSEVTSIPDSKILPDIFVNVSGAGQIWATTVLP